MLASLRAALIAVDRDLRIHAWNRSAEEFWGLCSDEVNGMHLLNLDIGLPLDELHKPVRACLETGEPQGVVADASNRRGRGIECRVTCTPLHRPLDDVDGVILLMEATERK